MHFDCEVCGVDLDLGDAQSCTLDLERAMVTCFRCRGVFGLGARDLRRLDHPCHTDLQPNFTLQRLPVLTTPSGYRDDGRRPRQPLQLTWRRYTPGSYVVIIFGALIMAAPHLLALLAQRPIFGLTGQLVAVALGMVPFYFGLMLRLNRVVIKVDERELEVRYGPLPALGGARYPATAVEQVYCTKSRIEMRGRRWDYKLEIRLRGRGDRVLVEINAEAEEVPRRLLYLERQLESLLGIDDRELGVVNELRATA